MLDNQTQRNKFSGSCDPLRKAAGDVEEAVFQYGYRYGRASDITKALKAVRAACVNIEKVLIKMEAQDGTSS